MLCFAADQPPQSPLKNDHPTPKPELTNQSSIESEALPSLPPSAPHSPLKKDLSSEPEEPEVRQPSTNGVAETAGGSSRPVSAQNGVEPVDSKSSTPEPEPPAPNKACGDADVNTVNAEPNNTGAVSKKLEELYDIPPGKCSITSMDFLVFFINYCTVLTVVFFTL